MQTKFMEAAIALAAENLPTGTGGPFGAVIVKKDKIIGRGKNQVLTLNDPTAHAEVLAIRDACKRLNYFHLEGCELYTSCEPCPMCLSSCYWARIEKIYFAATPQDAEAIGFIDNKIYQELTLPLHNRRIAMQQLMAEKSRKMMRQWSGILY